MKPVSIAACVLGMLGQAFAYPITYSIRFQVTSVSEKWNSGNPGDLVFLFDYKPAIGDVFTGSMRLEDSVGSVDGTDRMGGLLGLDLNLAGLSWTYDEIIGNSGALTGFRSSHGLGAVSPSFAFAGGELQGWQGGVYGAADYPFIDFLGSSFSSVDASFSVISGTTTFQKIAMVPEPSTLVYFLLPIVGWFLTRRSRRPPRT